ncbi:helix-turn-helix transcriptional regulator [Streptomyces coelicoflavus]|uniref:helix-turn-helix transcriptional regulator n=1 Tax=Streptomyces coelicoflavus TaxID=285562 RepID=UPI002E265D39
MPEKTSQDWRPRSRNCTRPVLIPLRWKPVHIGCRRKPVVINSLRRAGTTGWPRRDVAARMGVSIARVSQIKHGEVATLDVIARYVEELGGRLDLVADSGDHTLRMPASADQGSAAA